MASRATTISRDRSAKSPTGTSGSTPREDSCRARRLAAVAFLVTVAISFYATAVVRKAWPLGKTGWSSGRRRGPTGLEEIIRALCGEALEYRERSSPRHSVAGRVYTSTDYPPAYPIFLHNENSYQKTWPLKIFFLCETPSETGGETPIADCRRVLARIDQGVRDQGDFGGRHVGDGSIRQRVTLSLVDMSPRADARANAVKVDFAKAPPKKPPWASGADRSAASTTVRTARQWQWTISLWKNMGLNAAQAEAQAKDDNERVTARIMARYEERLAAYQSVDFDDLIGLPLKLLRDFPEVREKWQKQLGHVLVDEYQDTNATQYELLKLLVGERGRFTAVGDDDQSIYGWRGATLDNLRKLPVDYPTLKVVKFRPLIQTRPHVLFSRTRAVPLIARRFVSGRIRRVTTTMDKVLYVALTVMVVLGMSGTVVINLFGEGYDYRETIAVWFRGIFWFHPEPLIGAMNASAAYATPATARIRSMIWL